ncbi:hypothetical protein Sjap_000594 [Stephania japonica]|uniref:SHSP domain-containing protein n=1 Tax=Stephania japonica TaxID=461633 RepID=A0AAP0PSM8_9MAGN
MSATALAIAPPPLLSPTPVAFPTIANLPWATAGHLFFLDIRQKVARMDKEVLQRRMNMIVGHFSANIDQDLSSTNILPLNCSSTMNSVIRRCDNRLLFARQGSMSQGHFMRQAAIKENLGQVNSFRSTTPSDIIKPLSSPIKQDCTLSMEPPPSFSRPNRGLKYHNPRDKNVGNVEFSSPRMIVAESNYNYTMTIELPGVLINDVRVEVDDQNLIVMGRRPTQWWRVACGSEDFISRRRKEEDPNGRPYHVVWPLPSNVNKDGVSAEFV